MFDDPDFPATARSLYAHKKPSIGGPITWLRPHVSLFFLSVKKRKTSLGRVIHFFKMMDDFHLNKRFGGTFVYF